MFTVGGVLLLTITYIRGSSNPPSPFWGVPGPVLVYQRPIEAMVDVTNDLGVAVLQDFAYTRSNFAFSPYGVASVLVVLYEGARGESARQIHNTLRLPWNRDITRIGFRDIHRHLRSYFSHEGYLSGLTLNKNQTSLLIEYRRVLRFYGYDVGTGQGDQFPPTTTTKKPTTTTTTLTPEPTTSESTTEHVETTSEPSTETMETTTMDPRSMVTEEETTTTEAAISTSPPQEVPEITTEPMIPSPAATTIAATTEDIIPSITENTIPSTTEDIIPPTTTTRMTTEEGVTLITLTIPRETTPRPIADEPVTEISSNPPIQDEETTVQPEASTISVPETTELSSKEMPEEPAEETPVPPEVLMEPTEAPEVSTESPDETTIEIPEISTEATGEITTVTPEEAISTEVPVSVADEAATESPILANEEPVTQPVETMAPTEVPEVETFVPTEAPEEKVTMGSTEPESEIIVTTIPVEPTTESISSGTEAEEERTQTTTENNTEITGETSTSEVGVTVSTSSPDSENTIPDGSTVTLGTTELGTTTESETLTGSMSKIVESRVKFNVPFPLVYNQSETSSDRIKRSISDGVVVFPDISLQLQNGMYDSQIARGNELYTQLPKRPFLVDGVAEELVPVMSYTAIFPFAYIRRLHAQVLEFPLDDERYKLLLLLPVERRGLRQLIYDLSSCPLREIYQAMRPTRVQAIIPSFMVEGFVILTPTLQQLGIWDVFDPRRANLSGMSNDPDLYVRNIEQAVTVVIRNYVKILDIQTRTMAARATLERFIVTHPFLYFVMDTDTHVALMAGKIVDPMNSRIY